MTGEKLGRTLVAAIILMLVSFNVLAYTPPPAPRPPTDYIADVANKLSPADRHDLNVRIDRINARTKNEIAILIIPSLEGEDISDVAHATFNAWGVGKRGLDNGVLIVVAIADRKSRIETGKGVEGELTDLQSNDILKKNVSPHFKQGDFYGGLSEGVDVIAKTLESRRDAGVAPQPAVPPPPVNDSPAPVASCSASNNIGSDVDMSFLILFGLGVVGFIIWRMLREPSSPSYSEPTWTPPPPRRYVAPPPPPMPEPVYSSPRRYSRPTPSYTPPVYVPVPVPSYSPPSYSPPSEPSYSPPSYSPPSYSSDSSSSSSSSSDSSSSSSSDYGSSSSSDSSSSTDYGGGSSGGGGSSDSW